MVLIQTQFTNGTIELDPQGSAVISTLVNESRTFLMFPVFSLMEEGKILIILICFTSGSRRRQGRERRRWWSRRVCESANTTGHIWVEGSNVASSLPRFPFLPVVGIPWTSRWEWTNRPPRKEGKVTALSKSVVVTLIQNQNQVPERPGPGPVSGDFLWQRLCCYYCHQLWIYRYRSSFSLCYQR